MRVGPVNNVSVAQACAHDIRELPGDIHTIPRVDHPGVKALTCLIALPPGMNGASGIATGTPEQRAGLVWQTPHAESDFA